MNLELLAMSWLWREKNCHYILRERSPRWGIGEPDVLAATKDRFLIEVEIKRSLGDFYAESRKRHRRERDYYITRIPKFFYYCAERKLAAKLVDKVPEWAGLIAPMDGAMWQVQVLKRAPANNASKKLSLEECVKATRQMVNHLMSLEVRIDHERTSLVQGKYYDDFPIDGDFQI
jgi:hypothetical protein